MATAPPPPSSRPTRTTRSSLTRGAKGQQIKKKKKDKAECDEEDEEERDLDEELFQSSGSDFEEEMKTRKKMRKLAGKRREESSSSSEEDDGLVDDDDDDFVDSSSKRNNKGKSLPKKRGGGGVTGNCKRKSSILEATRSKRSRVSQPIPKIRRDLNANSNGDSGVASCSSNSTPMIVEKLLPAAVNLSESSSDDDDDDDDKPKHHQVHHHRHRNADNIASESAKNKSPCKKSLKEEDKAIFATQLHALAASYSQQSSGLWSATPTASASNKPSSSSSTLGRDERLMSEDKYAQEVAEALAMGEAASERLSDDDEDDEEEEESMDASKVDCHQPTDGNIEVTVEVPSHHRKKKKQQFDVEAYVKREIGKARREVQLLMHQTHILCLLAHLRHLNGQLSQCEELRGVALSLVPVANLSPPSSLTSAKLSQMLKWFRSTVKLGKCDRLDMFPRPIATHLLKCLRQFTAESNQDLVLMMLVVLRSVGWRVRLVLNLATVPLKPGKEDNNISIKVVKVENEETSKYFATSNPRQSTSRNSRGLKSDEKDPDHASQSSATSSKSANKGRARSSDRDVSNAKPGTSKSPADALIDKGRIGEKDKRGLRVQENINLTKDSKRNNTRSRSWRSTLQKVDSKSGKGNSRTSEEKPRKACNRSVPRREASRGREKEQNSQSERESDVSTSPAKKKRRSKLILSKSALAEADSRKASSGTSDQKARKRGTGSGEDDDDDDKDFVISPKKASRSAGRGSSSSKARLDAGSSDYWLEVLVKTDWVCVDVVNTKINCQGEMEARASKPMLYVMACNGDGTVKDVTRRYAKNYLTQARKQRVDQEWFEESLEPLASVNEDDLDREEEEKLTKMMEETPMPTTVGEFKGHPLYALKRHLLKFEGIYPSDAPTLGFVRGEPVYARQVIHTMHCRTTWLKEGRVVKINEEPYKIVKARPKWNRMSGTVTKDLPLELFGHWQTEVYVPPPAKDGKVPRNEYGNVELFKPWMLPKGTVHVPIQGLSRIAKKLSIDCAPAMMGWDFHSGGNHPVFDGFVVCKEFSEILVDAWNQDVEERAKRAEEKREKRILDNWKKLVRGLVIAHRIKLKYLKEEK